MKRDLDFDIKAQGFDCDLVCSEEEQGNWNREPGWYCRVFPRWGRERQGSPVFGPFLSYAAAMIEEEMRARKLIEAGKKGNS